MSEKYKLTRNDSNYFAKGIVSISSFSDVILVSEDMKEFSAHKLILSATSRFFKAVLEQRDFGQTVICLDKVSSVELRNILDFVYQGEVLIEEVSLQSFMNVAERFELDGLFSQKDKIEACNLPFKKDLIDLEKSSEPGIYQTSNMEYREVKQNIEKLQPLSLSDFDENDQITDCIISSKDDSNEEEKAFKLRKIKFTIEDRVEKKTNTIEKLQFPNLSGFNNVEELDKKLNELITREKNGKFSCFICMKETRNRVKLMEHVETHLNGLAFPCEKCDGKSFKTRNSLRVHSYTHH